MSATLGLAGPPPGDVDAAADQAIAACGGDAREAVKARLVTIVSRGRGRRAPDEGV